MSTGSVDERIRAVLDLGDSSGAVKALDAEVQKLLEDFKKQTELFEQKKMAPQAYADAVSKLKSEVGGLSGAIKELGGGGGGGSNLDAVSSKLFALERGMSALASGSGLGRAAGLLESGLSLLGSPAGIGAILAGIAYTIDQAAPKIKSSWDGMWKQFSEEHNQAKMAELKQSGDAMKAQVDDFFTRPVPGTEGMEAERQKKLVSMFNVGTGTGDKNLRVGLLRALQQSQGASPTALSGEEKQIYKDIWGKLFPAEAGKEAMEQQGTLGGIMKGIEQIAEMPAQMWVGKEKYVANLQLQMNALLERAAARSVSDLLIKLHQGGHPGVQAAEQLKDMISRFPQLFNPGMITQIEQVLKLGKQIQTEAGGGPGVGRAESVYRVKTETDLQREQEIEGLEGSRIGGRGDLEKQDRQMFERDTMQKIMQANPQLNIAKPEQRKLIEDEVAAQWKMLWGGPHTRQGQEQMERESAQRGRTAELLGEHPEMNFDEVVAQSQRETQRRERAIYPERFRRTRKPTKLLTGEEGKKSRQERSERENRNKAARIAAQKARESTRLTKQRRQRLGLPDAVPRAYEISEANEAMAQQKAVEEQKKQEPSITTVLPPGVAGIVPEAAQSHLKDVDAAFTKGANAVLRTSRDKGKVEAALSVPGQVQSALEEVAVKGVMRNTQEIGGFLNRHSTVMSILNTASNTMDKIEKYASAQERQLLDLTKKYLGLSNSVDNMRRQQQQQQQRSQQNTTGPT